MSTDPAAAPATDQAPPVACRWRTPSRLSLCCSVSSRMQSNALAGCPSAIEAGEGDRVESPVL
jgi:hypothetical protein